LVNLSLLSRFLLGLFPRNGLAALGTAARSSDVPPGVETLRVECVFALQLGHQRLSIVLQQDAFFVLHKSQLAFDASLSDGFIPLLHALLAVLFILGIISGEFISAYRAGVVLVEPGLNAV